MAKSVSALFKDAWAEKYGQDFVVRIYYKRRYWNGSAYAYESTWSELNGSSRCGRGQGVGVRGFAKISRAVWKLDTPFLNSFKASNITLELPNIRNEWLPGNDTGGFFRSDITSPDGYEPFLTQFQIRCGYILSDGTEELVPIFTGVAIDYIFATGRGYVEVVVSGNERLLQTTDAQNVSSAITGGATTDIGDNKFKTNATSIGIITNVYDNGVLKELGADYSISGLSEYGVGATIELTYTAAGAVTYDGTQWLTIQKIEDLVELLAIEAGLTSYNISAVVFPSVSSRIAIDTDGEWRAGTFSGTSADIVENALCLSPWGFESGDLSGWTAETGSGAFALAQAPGHSGSYSAFLSASTGSEGVTGSSYACLVNELGVESSRQDLSDVPNEWHEVTLQGNGSFYVRFYCEVGGSWARITSQAIVMDGAGSVRFWFMNVTGGTFLGSRERIRIDDVTSLHLDASGEWLSAEIDLGDAPVSWGSVSVSGQENGGSWTIKTQTSATSGSGYEDLADLGPGSVPTSTKQRYLKIYARLDVQAGYFSGYGPTIESIILTYSGSTIVMAMANFSSMTAFDAIQKLARLANYEFGFDGNGVFFFRSKIPGGSAVVNLSQADGISQISQFRYGTDLIINSAQVTYNGYFAKWDSTDAAEAHPTSIERFGKMISSEDMSDLLLAYDANLAEAVARARFEANHLPMKRFKMRTKIIPHLDLGDIVGVSYYEDPKDEDNIFGDPLRTMGEAPMGLPENVLARGMECKVIGIEFDPMNRTCDLEVQEIL